jgi:hypothetical protein
MALYFRLFGVIALGMDWRDQGVLPSAPAVQDGRIYIERINSQFLEDGGSPVQFRAAVRSR